MTDKLLEKFEIFPEKTRMNSHRYWCNVTQPYLTITKDMTHTDLLEEILKIGKEEGIEIGKAQRSDEIKKLINNE